MSQARFLHFPGPGSTLCSTTLPHRRYVGGFTSTVSWSLTSSSKSVSVAPAEHQTQLWDSVRSASPKFRGIRFTSVKAVNAPVLRAEIAVLLAKDAIEPVPPASMRSGFCSPYLIVPKKSGGLWPILDLRVLNRTLHKLPFRVRLSPRLVCSDQPEGRVLPCLDPPVTQTIPAIRVRGSGISIQGPALWTIPVVSHLHQSCGGGPCSPERTGCVRPQLPRRLAHTCAVSRAVVCTQGPGAQAPQPVGSSGQLGKEKTHANAEHLVSRHGIGFGQPDSTPQTGTCSVGAKLPQDFNRQDGGPTETFSEAPGAYEDCFSTGSMAESRGGHGNAVLTRFRFHRPATQPSARGQIPRSFGQEGPFSRYPGILRYSRMSRPLAGEPRTTGTQCQGYGRVPNCVGISIASSC